MDPTAARFNIYRALHNSVGAGNAAGAAIIMRHWPVLYQQWKLSIADPGDSNVFLQLTTGTIVYLSTDDTQVVALREINGLVDDISVLIRGADTFLHVRLAILLANLGLSRCL